MAENKDSAPAPVSIVTPCHGSPLVVLTTYQGSYTGSDVPSEIVCGADGCFNSWSADGTADLYNKTKETP